MRFEDGIEYSIIPSRVNHYKADLYPLMNTG